MLLFNPLDFATNREFNEKFKAHEIENKKRIGDLRRRMLNNAKGESCLLCGKKLDGFCNSHTIPEFILKNIAVNGKIRTVNSILNIEMYDKEKGVRNTGIFRQICKQCDSEIFKPYEDELSLINTVTDRMMYAIAIKNFLKMIDKTFLEIERNNLTRQIDDVRYVKEMDLQEYFNALEETKLYCKLNKKHKYRIIVDELLNYRVPIAFQSTVALIMDLDGNIINDVYCPLRDYKVEELHICVFPLRKNTRILLFVNRNYKHYNKFTKNQMKKYPINELLSIINYIIFLYSEDIYLRSDLSEDILKQLFPVSKISMPEVYRTNYFEQTKSETEKFIRKYYDLRRRIVIPNLLSEEYKVVI